MKILVAMSGGVDSSVAALLLKQQGHEIAGITMILGYRDPRGILVTIGETAARDAASVCAHLAIPHYTLDCTHQFELDVIDNFISEYEKGRTPNPCVRCNKSLKFGALINEMKELGYDHLATGHYADKGVVLGKDCIKKNKDPRKDQSYFLWSIDRSVLPQILFPLNELEKSDIRRIAAENNLSVAHKSESQDICFIPDDYRDFIKERISSNRHGNFVNSAGKVLGKHNGIPFYTIGQRRGLGVSAPAPLYVESFNLEKNEVVLGYKDEIRSQGLIARQVNLFTDELPSPVAVKIRYSQREIPCTARIDGDSLEIIFDEPQESVTPGQSAVLYHANCVIGGGVIDKAIHHIA
ncbi:MAG TPA: tRNA 2-thiouridine(34) synthase MnmA [Spirochaetota bacterium]